MLTVWPPKILPPMHEKNRILYAETSWLSITQANDIACASPCTFRNINELPSLGSGQNHRRHTRSKDMSVQIII